MIQQLKYFSMFSGIGGFEYGIQQALPNAECVGYSEIDKYAIQTYERHFKHKNYGDCTKINPNNLPDFDMLCGGFPCQAFSVAGKRRGFKDTRGTLFFEIARILEVKRPKIILLENVKGLLNHNKGETFRVIIQTLSELGYDVQWMVLNSKFFGVPQNRERVFIIGSIRGTSRPEILPFSRTDTKTNQEGINHPTLTEAIGRQGCSKEYIRSCQTILDINQAQRVYSTEGTSITIKGLGGGQGAKTGLYAIGVQGDLDKRKTYLKNEIGTLSANPTSDNIPRIIKTMEKQPIYDEEGNRTPEAHRIYDINGISPCFKNAVAIDVYNKSLREECPTLSDLCHNSIRMFDGMQIRRLTPIECERLQGFEDGWTEGVSDTQRYKQCGNAVTTKVIKSIVEQLIVGKFTQNSTSSGFPTENSPNMRYQETSEEVSQILPTAELP